MLPIVVNNTNLAVDLPEGGVAVADRRPTS